MDPAEETWNMLEEAVLGILNNKTDQNYNEQLCISAKHMVLLDCVERIYSGLEATLSTHLVEILPQIQAAGEDGFLEELSHRWKKYERALNTVTSLIKNKLNRSRSTKHKTPLYEIGLNQWRDNVIHSDNIQNRLRSTLLELIRRERTGEVYEDLGRMYNLFCRVPNGLSTIRDVMTSHFREIGKQLVTDPEKAKDPVEFVQRLLDERDKYDNIIVSAFNNDETFQDALNSSFKYFINLNPHSPEFISLFVDDKLRKGLKGVSEDGVEIMLGKVMMLFRNLQEKDVFEEYYRKHLAKRLLSGKTGTVDAERSLIVKLKTECGYQLTSKLEGMLTDMMTFQDTMQGFYTSQAAKTGDGPTLVVKVLRTGSWPIQPSPRCNLPGELSTLCEKFKSYYLGTHTGRRLSWQTNMGTADIKATFGKGQEHELNVSTYQMCVLMLFNNTDQLSYKEIEQATEIHAPELKRCLQSLACVKGKNVLRKEPMSKDIGENDSFLFNDKFTSKLYKVKIGMVVAQKESEPEKQETRERVEENRKPQIDAAVVRIMKSRRVLDHNDLITEVTKQLQSRFLPNPVEIKKRIESLIDRDFLERDSSDRKVYRYLA